MTVSTKFGIRHSLVAWVAIIDGQEYDHNKLTARIKSMIKKGENVEEEWAALAIIDRRTTEDRWAMNDKSTALRLNLPRYEQ